MRTWLLRITGSLLGLTFLFWCAAHLWLPGAIKNAVEIYGNKIGYQITYKDLSISPLRLRIEIDGLRLVNKYQGQLLDLKKSVVMLKWSHLIIGELGFDEILLDGPSIKLEKTASKAATGQWNWQELISAITRNLPPMDSAAPKKNIKISVDQFQLVNGSFEVLDPNKNLHEQFKSLSIELLDIANYDKQGEVNGVRGQYEFNLGALNFTLPGLNKKIAFKHLAIKGSLDNPALDTLGAQIDFEIDEGRISSHWDFKADKSIAAKVQIDNISITPFVTLLPANTEILTQGGVIQSVIDVSLKDDALSISGDLHLLGLDLLEQGQKQSVVKWNSGDVSRFVYQSSKNSGASLSIDELSVSQPALQFEIDEKGFS
ncbi:DUF748 domain-containing protein, partial [Polynucleobacter sp. 35-46-11]|uniref:DUF748 domain-containing protein n=1 Tax=Polynucleobacter sp. 35-46-11 TaxID=1970425 RepID=UPI00345DF3A1